MFRKTSPPQASSFLAVSAGGMLSLTGHPSRMLNMNESNRVQEITQRIVEIRDRLSQLKAQIDQIKAERESLVSEKEQLVQERSSLRPTKQKD